MKYFLIFTLLFLTNCKTDSEAKSNEDASSDPDLSVKDGSNQKDLSKKDQSSKTDMKIGKDGGEKDLPSTDGGNQDCGKVDVVQFSTTDGVKLTADYHPPAATAKGAVILFHMIPPSNNRKGYPLRVREAFSKAGYAVLNVDRRGAGESEGTAKDAYSGPKGRFDVEAAVKFVLSTDRKCASNPQKIMLVGASNGTTSVMDYTTGRDDKSLPDPKAVAWLSPGSYTEGQNKIADHKAQLQALSLLIVHPSGEPYANAFKNFSENWKIITLDKGRHGTNNFDGGKLEDLILPALINWADKTIGD